MNRISNVLIGLTLLICISCDKGVEKQTANGFKFKVVKNGDGVRAQKEEILVYDYLLKDSKDSVWNNTHVEGMPTAIQINDTSAMAAENGIVQMFRMLSKGDSVTVTLPIEEFFMKGVGAPVPNGVDTSIQLSYCIQVRNIMKMDEFKSFQTEIMEKKKALQIGKDATIISKYLSENNITTAQQDTSGLRYVIHTSKGGSRPTVENCVEVSYRGKFLKDGKVFDESEKISFPLNGVIPGWQLGIPKLGIGDSATFYIPSGLAYGPTGYPGAIPSDAILIFDVELLGFGGDFDEATRTCK